jgi:hypothetical protein
MPTLSVTFCGYGYDGSKGLGDHGSVLPSCLASRFSNAAECLIAAHCLTDGVASCTSESYRQGKSLHRRSGQLVFLTWCRFLSLSTDQQQRSLCLECITKHEV